MAMKVLQALFFPPEQPGGVSSMIPYVKERFVQKGWDMEIFSLPKRVRNKGAEQICFDTFDISAFEGLPIVDKYIQTFKDYVWWSKLRLSNQYDFIHAHHPIAALVMKMLFPDTPLLLTIHSSYERELMLNNKISENSLEHQFFTLIYRELEAKMSCILTVSHSFREYLRPYVENIDCIKVIPNGYDEQRFRPMPHHNDVIQLITVCRLVPAKGLDTLLYACAKLKQRGLPFVLHIIGDGPMRPQLEQLAIDLNLYDDIIFYGYMLHPEQFMPFFDVFVLPSQAEAFGSVFAEAALCQLALVGTNVGGIAEQIEDGSNGLLVPVGDVEALAEVLQKVIENRELLQTLAKNACQKAKSVYSLSRVIEQLEAVYLEL